MRKYDVPQKRLCICAMYCGGKDIDSISRILGVSRYIVKSAIRRMFIHGSIFDEPRSGRPTKVSSRDVRHVKYVASRELQHSARFLANSMGYEHGIAINRHQVAYALRFKRFVDRNAPRITPKWYKSRRQFYYTHLNHDWKHTVFTDEKEFSVTPNGRIRFYARSYEEYQEKHHKLPLRMRTKVKVWGVITRNGVGPLIRVDPHMNSDQYTKQILEPLLCNHEKRVELLGCGIRYPNKLIWQQDNASFHHGPTARAFFKKHGITVMKWPPNSPDLSPIENVWNMIAYRLRLWQIKTGSIAPEGDLFKAVKTIWESITLKECRMLFDSMPDRMNELFRRSFNAIDF